MLPPFIIEQIRKREEEQERVQHQPQLELPMPHPRPGREPRAEEEPERGVVIIDVLGD